MATTVINLKGRIREYGPRLEHAPSGLVYVGRRMAGVRAGGWDIQVSPFANPHNTGRRCRTCGGQHDNRQAAGLYREYLLGRPELLALIPELRGRILACWCAPEPCHAHVLAALADDTPIPNVPEGQLF